MILGSKFRGFDHWLLKLVRVTTAALLVIMFLVIMVEVVSRYVFDSPVFWAEELARYVMFYMVLIGSVAAMREQKHPALTFIVAKFHSRFRRIGRLVIDLVVFSVLVVVLIEGYEMALDERIMQTPALRISFLWVYFALPVGALLMMLELIAKHLFGRGADDGGSKAESTSGGGDV